MNGELVEVEAGPTIGRLAGQAALRQVLLYIRNRGAQARDRAADSKDPVISVWLALVDTDPQPPPAAGGLLDMFRPPLIVLGMSGLADLSG